VTRIGWDVGGAHLKAVALDGDRIVAAHILPCPLWQGLEHLREAAQTMLAVLPAPASHALTMTGELCDLFAGRAEGVAAILEEMRRALAPASPLVWVRGRGLVAIADPAMDPLAIASMNWHAMASALAARAPAALLVDVGSTTTDVLAIVDGEPRTRGTDDRARLASDELVYQGVARTPVMALAARVPYRGRWQSLAAEYFATTADVYRLLGQLPHEADLLPSADGRAKTVALSAARLARMVGDDGGPVTLPALVELAAWLRGAQLGRLREAALRVADRAQPAMVVGAGVGRFLVRELARLLGLPYLDYAEALGVGGAASGVANDCAPALALARLAA
jgi:probable H4MPT-linked C1 transfer pathway protein